MCQTSLPYCTPNLILTTPSRIIMSIIWGDLGHKGEVNCLSSHNKRAIKGLNQGLKLNPNPYTKTALPSTIIPNVIIKLMA